jgi:drug/metabolite transporter (DMT)-like permease
VIAALCIFMFVPYKNKSLNLANAVVGNYCLGTTSVTGGGLRGFSVGLALASHVAAGANVSRNRAMSSRSSLYWPITPAALLREKLLGLSRWWANSGLTGTTFNFLMLSGFYQFRDTRRVSSADFPVY